MGWEREIKSYRTEIQQESIATSDLLEVASDKVKSGYYLAHTLEGVIWGTPATLDEIPLNILTDLRLFNSSQQLHIWRDGDRWQTWYVQDEPDENGNTEAFDEYHILWGTSTEKTDDENITRLVEGAQGFRFTIPLELSLSEFDRDNPLVERVAMNVRHYLGEHDNGMNHVAFSRLTTIKSYDFFDDPDSKDGGT